MATAKLNPGLALLLVAGAATTLVVQQHTQAKLRRQVESLRQQIAQLEADNERLSNCVALAKAARAPRDLPVLPPLLAVATNTQELSPTNVYARFKDQPPKLTAEQVESYLKATGRKAANLLAAYRTSSDAALLQEAMQKYPNDQQVAFEAVFDKALSAEQRRQWLNAFQKSAPDNALPNYLSALDYFKSGETDQALQALLAASAQPQFNDYTLDRWQDDEEAYLAAGYSPAEAKLLGGSQLLLPQLAQLKQLGLQMVDLAKAYGQAGDDASAQSLLQMTLGLGQSYNGSYAGDCAISHLVGLSIQRLALSAMDPSSPFDASGRTVQDQLNDLTRQHKAISSAFEQNNALLAAMSDQDWMSYIDRQKSFGDEAALRWAVNKLAPK
jgi:hypothetical protein